MTSRSVNPYTQAKIRSAVTAVPNGNAALSAARSAYAGLNFGTPQAQPTPEPTTSVGGISIPTPRPSGFGTSVGGYSPPNVGYDPNAAVRPLQDGFNAVEPPRGEFDPSKFPREIDFPEAFRNVLDGTNTGRFVDDTSIRDLTADSYNEEIRSLLAGGGLDPEDQLYFDRVSQDIDLDFDRAMQDAQANLAALEKRRDDMLSIYGVKSPYLDAQIEREQERWQLQQQELKLRAEKAKSNVAEAQRNQVLTAANREALASAYEDYRGILDPLIQEAIGTAGEYFEGQREGSLAIESNENEGINSTYQQGVLEAMEGLGYSGEPIDQAAVSAALEAVNFGKFELSELSQARARGDENVARATEPYLVAEMESFGASDRASMARRALESDSAFDVREEQALQSVMDALAAQEATANDSRLAELGFDQRMDDLSESRDLMDLNLTQDLADIRTNIGLLSQDQQRVLEDMTIARERLGEDRNLAESKALAELLNMDANAYGERTAESYLETALQGYTPGRQEAIAATVADLLDQNITSSEGAVAQLQALVVDGVINGEEASIIGNALDQYSDGASVWDAGAVQDTLQGTPLPTNWVPGGQGTGSAGQVPGGEAANNIANRDHPLYQERAQFVSQHKGQVMDRFGLKDWGQWRDVDAEVNGNRSSNSDHYSGGANDFYGSMDAMQAAATHLQNQPYVSFVRIHEPGPHLHVSYMLGAGG